MRNLPSLLQRFSNLLNKQSLNIEAVSSVINVCTGRNVPLEQIFIKGSVLEIYSSPALKSEIMLKEDSIRETLKIEHKIFISRILYK